MSVNEALSKYLLIFQVIVYRNTWLGNTIIIFVIKQIC